MAPAHAQADLCSRQTDGSTPLLLAAYNGHCRVVRILVEAGTPLEARGSRNRAALHIAALAGQVRVAEELLALGADIDVQVEPEQ